jgi:hypothetical protein
MNTPQREDNEFPMVISKWLLLDEPELNANQVWIVIAVETRGDESRMLEGAVIANSMDEAMASVLGFQFAPLGAFDLQSIEGLIADYENHSLPEQIREGLQVAFAEIGAVTEAEILERLQKWRWALGEVKRFRGNGAMTDGRQHENAAEREDLIDLERQGQRVYWHFKSNLTHEELEAIPYMKFVSDVRALGQAYRDEARRRFAQKIDTLAGKGSIQ